MPQFLFPVSERLKSRKLIEKVFSEGRTIAVFPLRLVYVQAQLPPGAGAFQAGFSVSRRLFRSAVRRNRIKRQMREAFRLKKYKLAERQDRTTAQFAMMLLYTAREPLPYADIEEAMGRLFRRFIKT